MPVTLKADYAGYLIRKWGFYYRPNFSGYTANLAKAGRYTKAQAEAQRATEPDAFTICAAPEVIGPENLRLMVSYD